MTHFITLSDDDTCDGGRRTRSNCLFTTHPRHSSRNRGKSRQSPRFNSGHAHRGDPECFWSAVTTESKEEEIFMKTKGLLFISCLAAGALIASPSFGKPAKKSAGMSQSKAKRVAPHTTQAMRNDRHNQNISPRMGSTRYYRGTRYNGTRSYAGR